MHKRRLQRHKIELYSRLRCLKTKLSSYSGGSQNVFPGPAVSTPPGTVKNTHSSATADLMNLELYFQALHVPV